MVRFSASATRLCLVTVALAVPSAYAQATPRPAAQTVPASAPETPNNDPDGEVAGDQPEVPQTPAQLEAQAWKVLSTAVTDPKHPETRIQALAALGQMGSNPRSLKMIETAMQDHDVDVQTAAILAAGQTKAAAIRRPIHEQLNSAAPQVAFTAALTLWKMGDHSGEDILATV